MKSLYLILVTAIASVTVQGKNLQIPAEPPVSNALRSQGCYKSAGELKDPKGYDSDRVSSGFCGNDVCKLLNATVMAVKGTTCYCGSTYPPQDTLVDDSNCNYPCTSYPKEACGGISSGQYWSVFNTGIEVDVPNYQPPSSSSSSTTPTSTGPTKSATQTDTSSEKKANIGGIVGGVVVAVVAVVGAIGGVFFYLRRKRNKEIEEEHRRNAAVNSFIGHKPGSSGGLSITDARLDPVMAQRRLSDGSIADNHDYSRKILRVTNA